MGESRTGTAPPSGPTDIGSELFDAHDRYEEGGARPDRPPQSHVTYTADVDGTTRAGTTLRVGENGAIEVVPDE